MGFALAALALVFFGSKAPRALPRALGAIVLVLVATAYVVFFVSLENTRDALERERQEQKGHVTR
jgi:uncharacterized membrane protein YeiB